MKWLESKSLGFEMKIFRNIPTRRLLNLFSGVFVVALMAAGSQSAVASTADEWSRYKIKGEAFSVELPRLPAMTTRNVYLLSIRKNQKQRVLGSYGDGVAYVVSAFENAQGQSLDEFIEDTKRRGRYEWNPNPTNITVNGFAGKQFDIAQRDVPGTVQFVAAKGHLYEFQAVGAAADDPRTTRFFSSIVLDGKTEGTEVTDGIGAQPAAAVPTNQSEQLPTSKEVDRRIVLVTKPNPSYTEAARMAQTTGTVVLKMIFTADGGVSDIRVVSGLPNGLVEQSIAAAKKIRFVPAMKNGQFVSLWMQVEFNFNLY